MVNCNPETVSTDYDTSDRLYFEPLTLEHVMAIYRREQPLGAIVQLGGQTPLKLAHSLEAAGVNILGTRRRRSTWPRIAGASAICSRKRTFCCRRTAPPCLWTRPAAWRTRSVTRWSCALATCSAAAPCPSATTNPRCGATCAAPRMSRPDGGASRSLPRGRFRGRCRPGFGRQTRCGLRHHAAHRGGRHPLGRLGGGAAAVPGE